MDPISPIIDRDVRKIAVVTGASKGVGRGIAVALGEAGFDVAVNYRGDANGAEVTAEKIRGMGRRALVVKADVGFKPQVDHMFDVILEKLGTPAVLINNSGVLQTWKPLLDLAEEDWYRVIRTNLKGTFLCTQRAARLMTAKRWGRIINIGSGSNKAPSSPILLTTPPAKAASRCSRASLRWSWDITESP